MELKTFIESTYLYQDATVEEIKSLCLEARELEIAGVVVTPFYAREANIILKGNYAQVISPISYPLGQDSAMMKAALAVDAIKRGANEVEVMVNHSMIKMGDYRYLEREVKSVLSALAGKGRARFVLECSILSPLEILYSANHIMRAGGKAIVSGTAYAKRGVKVKDIEIIRKGAGPSLTIKAQGSILTFDQAVMLHKAGANLIGTSDPNKILF